MLHAKLLNIGRGGAFILLSKEFPNVGARVSFKMNFAQSPFFKIEGAALCAGYAKSKVKIFLPDAASSSFSSK